MNEEGVKLSDASKINLNRLTHESEKELIAKLNSLPQEIETAAQILEPSRLTRYLLDLSALFHSFYNSCRVKVDDGELMQARMFLIKNVRTVIRNTLAILKIDAPEKM